MQLGTLALYRNAKIARTSRRADVILLLDEGDSWRTIIRLTFCSNSSVSVTLTRFREDGVAGLKELKRRNVATPEWVKRAQTWLENDTPRNHGYFRARWTRELIATMLA